MKKKFTAAILLVLVLFTVVFASTACVSYSDNEVKITSIYNSSNGVVVYYEYDIDVTRGTVFEVEFTIHYHQGTESKTKTVTKRGAWNASDSSNKIDTYVSIEGSDITVDAMTAKVGATSASKAVYAIVPAVLAFGALVWLAVALVLIRKRNSAKAETRETSVERDEAQTSGEPVSSADDTQTSNYAAQSVK